MPPVDVELTVRLVGGLGGLLLVALAAVLRTLPRRPLGWGLTTLLLVLGGAGLLLGAAGSALTGQILLGLALGLIVVVMWAVLT